MKLEKKCFLSGLVASECTVTREGELSRSGMEEVDETEIFEGGENRLTMYQTYTREFQCAYQLTRYPFDTQVRFGYDLELVVMN